MEKGTKEIIKTIAIIVLVPTVAVGAYYGFKFARKKYNEKKERDKTKEGGSDKNVNVNKGFNTTGMVKYMIEIPSALRSKLFDNGEFFEAIKAVPYSFENIGSEGSKGISVNIKMLPENLKKMDDVVKKVNKEISIVTV